MRRNCKSRANRASRKLSWRNPAGEKPARRGGRLVFEPLEPRMVLNGGPLVISEFLTINDGILADEDAEFSDWN